MTTIAEATRTAHPRTSRGEQPITNHGDFDMTQQPIPGAVPQWTIGDRLRKAREFAELDQAQFADEVGISRRSVTNYEKGHSQPSRPVLLAWSLRTGVAMEWLTSGGGDGLPRQDLNLRPSDYTSAPSGFASLLHLRRDRRSTRRARQLVPAIEVAVVPAIEVAA